MPDLILAHDIGTSGDKATLYSIDGELVASVTADYPTRYFNGNWAEQNPHLWWDAVCLASRKVLSRVEPGRVGAVSFSGQMMGCVCLDSEGHVIRDAIIWADSRSVDQIDTLLTELDAETGYHITGHRLSPSYTLGKLLWIRDNEPENYQRIYKVLNPKDFVINRLTGEWVTDETDASGTNLFDIRQRRWSPQIMGAAGISPAILPDPVPSPTVVGEVTAAAAEQTGLRKGTPVVCGAGDGLCASVGAGCVSEGRVYASLGTSAWIATATAAPLDDPLMRTFTFAHAVPGLYGPCGTAQAVGASYNWARDAIYLDGASGRAGEEVHAAVNNMVASVPVGANGLIFLPYLLGERTPWWNPEARGAFIGLTMEHTKSDLLRAVVEGAFLTMGLILEIMRPSISATLIDVIGGFARGEVQQRIMADVFGMPLAISENLAEATSMGAAVIGGVGAGLLDGFDAVDRFRKVARIVEPNPTAHAVYADLVGILEESYRVLTGVYDRLAALNTDRA